MRESGAYVCLDSSAPDIVDSGRIMLMVMVVRSQIPTLRGVVWMKWTKSKRVDGG